VIVHNLNVVRVTTFPPKTDTPLIVDSDAMLPLTITDELLKLVRRWDTQIVYRTGSVQQQEFAQRHAPDSAESSGSLPAKHLLGFLATESPNHETIITSCDITVKRY